MSRPLMDPPVRRESKADWFKLGSLIPIPTYP